MLGYSRMANAINLKQAAIDEGVFGMDVEDLGAEFVNILDRVNKLANEMAGIPLDTEIRALGFVEEPFPHRWLSQHVVAHNRQMIRRHRAMLECDSHSFVGGDSGNRFPKLQQPPQEVFERFVH